MLGEGVKYYREKRELTLKQMSERTGIRKEYLKKIEEGKAPRILISHMEKILKVFDMTLDNFLC